jgi:uncharacterized protein YjbI with pentapeptide repeats
MMGTNLRKCVLVNVDFTGTVLKPMKIMGKDGKATGSMQKTILDGANMKGTDVSKIDLTQCSVVGTIFA